MFADNIEGSTWKNLTPSIFGMTAKRRLTSIFITSVSTKQQPYSKILTP